MTNRPSCSRPPRVLCVGGTDSSGCSGLAADIRTVAALGGHGLVAVTAVTAQDTRQVSAVLPVAPAMVRAQIQAALGDGGVDAVKIGMLVNTRVVRGVASALSDCGKAAVVADPVLRSTTGGELLDDAGLAVFVSRLLPQVSLCTPNLPEAEVLLGHRIRGIAGMRAAARAVRDLGAAAVLVKGGHRRGAAVDVYAGADGVFLLESPRIDTANTRGTGCVLSSACASLIALGHPVADAVRLAKAFVSEAIRLSYPTGAGAGPVDPVAAGTLWMRRTVPR